MYTKKSGFITIAGRPNVGKSTLINMLVGEKVAIVSNRPQTTRNSILGILNTDSSQMIFTDTPGMHRGSDKLSEFMVKSINSSMQDTDIVMFVTEPLEEISDTDMRFIERFKNGGSRVLLIINKTDLYNRDRIANAIIQYSELYEFDAVIPICAKNNKQRDALITEIEKLLLPGPIYYDEDIYTDQPEKVIASEILREKTLKSLADEIPHGIAVEIALFRERADKEIIDIEASIYCEREGHKPIIIGKNGDMLKLIATRARQDMEKLLGMKVNLKCRVKVRKDWKNNTNYLRDFGYKK